MGRLLVIGLLNIVPCPQPLGFLVRKVNIAFLGGAFVAHHIDFIAGLEAGVALMIEDFGESGSMPSDFAPISTTTWVGVSFNTVPFST